MKEVEDKVKPVKKVTIQERKYNARLYPFYKMCAWDLLFYYAIAFVFLVQTNGMSPAEVMFTVIAIAMSTCFKEVCEIKEEKAQTLKGRIQGYFQDIKTAFQFIFHSRRLQAIMVFTFFFSGLVYASYTLRESLLDDLQIPAQFFAIIIASLTILSGFTTSLAIVLYWMKDKFGLKPEEYRKQDIQDVEEEM